MNETSEQQGQGNGSAAQDDVDFEVAGRPRLSSRRSPIVSAAVVAIGTYLMVSMFSDARYWARSETPRDLGDAAALVSSGGLQEDLAEQYVVLEGTPDARTAARYKLGDRQVQLLRVVEGGGSLFAAVPRTPDMKSDQYAGRYEGRMRRLSSTRMMQWIEQYYADLGVSESLEVSAEALARGLGSGRVETMGGAVVPIAANDRVSLSLAVPDVRLQLGRKSFTRRADARAAVAALGFPFYEPEEQDNAKFYQFWARIPEAERDAARAKLNADVEQGEGPQASFGAVILPGSATFWMKASELRVEGEAFTFARRPGMPLVGFDVGGEALVPIADDGGQVRVPIARVRSAQLQKSLEVNPNGYIINVGEKPSSHRVAMLLWLAALLVVGLNIASLVLYWRRRSA